jgi:hypothetical protein
LASGDGGGVITHHAAFHPFHIFFIRPHFFYPSVFFLSVRPLFIGSVPFLSVPSLFYPSLFYPLLSIVPKSVSRE